MSTPPSESRTARLLGLDSDLPWYAPTLSLVVDGGLTAAAFIVWHVAGMSWLGILAGLCVYPLLVVVLRGLTGQSAGDRVAGQVYKRESDGARPGMKRCLTNEVLALGLPPYFDMFSEHLTGLRISRSR